MRVVADLREFVDDRNAGRLHQPSQFVEGMLFVMLSALYQLPDSLLKMPALVFTTVLILIG